KKHLNSFSSPCSPCPPWFLLVFLRAPRGSSLPSPSRARRRADQRQADVQRRLLPPGGGAQPVQQDLMVFVAGDQLRLLGGPLAREEQEHRRVVLRHLRTQLLERLDRQQ